MVATTLSLQGSAVAARVSAAEASSSRQVAAARPSVAHGSSMRPAVFGGASVAADRISVSASRAASMVVNVAASDAPAKPAKGLVRYETMVILRPDIDVDDQEAYLAKLEAFLSGEGASDVECLVRGVQRLSYPIGGYWDGCYVMVSYVSKPKVPKALQNMFDAPVVGEEKKIMRYMTHKI